MEILQSIREKHLDASYFIKMADEKFLPLLLGDKYSHILNRLYRLKRNLYSFQNTLVAKVENKIAGMAWIYGAELNGSLGFLTWIGILIRNPGVGLRILLIKRNRLSDLLAEESLYLFILSTHRDYRKNGVGSQLLAEIEKVAKERKYKTVELDVEESNRMAADFYEKKGYETRFSHIFYQGKVKSNYIRMYKEILP